ncbi:MAG: hypothetical protein K2X01_07345 [Cyanobacteria bacterium]|nr:hypothetical protein [Cyanobacteriota bacterium]
MSEIETPMVLTGNPNISSTYFTSPFPARPGYTGYYPGGYYPGLQTVQAAPVLKSPPEIEYAKILLQQIQHLPGDEAYLRQLGVDILFQNGMEAARLIASKNIHVDFGDMGDSLAHAHWEKETNRIIINQKYRGDFSRPTLYAISEAIYHEAGHAARLGDDQSSLQEEINCLALNTLAHRFHLATDPSYVQTVSTSRLISDGVALYNRLFFDADPSKQALVRRVIEKYGELPPESPDHRVPLTASTVPLTDRVLRQMKNQNGLVLNQQA